MCGPFFVIFRGTDPWGYLTDFGFTFGVPWPPLGFILAPLWLQFGFLERFWLPFGPLLGSFFGGVEAQVGVFWCAFGDILKNPLIVLQRFLVRTLSSLGPWAELLPQATEINQNGAWERFETELGNVSVPGPPKV